MKLTVLMTTYNVEQYIEETIESLLNQTYKDFKLLIIDDASIDRTVDIIKEFDDPRIEIIELKENVGVGRANNIGLKYVNTEFVAKADSDDIYISTRLEKQINFMERNNDIDVVKSSIRFFPDNATVRDTARYEYFKTTREMLYNSGKCYEEIKEILYHWDCVSHNSVMCRTDSIRNIGYEDLRFGEDTTLFYKLNDRGYKIGSINEFLVKFRVRNNSITAGVTDVQFDFKYNLKREKIMNFINGDIYIWGTGSLARVAIKNLTKDNLDNKIVGFIDGTINKYDNTRSFYNLGVYPKEILCDKKAKVLVAAEPAILSCVRFFDTINYKMGKDYYIL